MCSCATGDARVGFYFVADVALRAAGCVDNIGPLVVRKQYAPCNLFLCARAHSSMFLLVHVTELFSCCCSVGGKVLWCLSRKRLSV